MLFSDYPTSVSKIKKGRGRSKNRPRESEGLLQSAGEVGYRLIISVIPEVRLHNSE